MNARTMTVGCPVCDARPGEWCTNEDGIATDTLHIARFTLVWGMSAPAWKPPCDPWGGRSAHAPPPVGVLQLVPSEPFGRWAHLRRERAAARTRRSIELHRELPWGPGGRR